MGKERHSNRFTQAQKTALLKAVLIDGYTPAETWRAAMAGTLGLPAFDPGRRYVYQLVKRGREAFELEHPEALAKSTEKALILAHTANLKHLRDLASNTDPTERARVAKAVAETQRALSASQKQTPRATTTTTAEPTHQPASDTTVTDLLSRTRQGAGTSSHARSRTGETDGPSASPVSAA